MSQKGKRSYEFCALTNLIENGGSNFYLMAGGGAACCYTNAIFMLSRQKRAALCAELDQGGLRAVAGPFYRRTQSARMNGIDSSPSLGALTNRITFQMWKRPSLP